MKTINFCLFLFCIGIFSCKKTQVDAVTGPRAGWTTIDFNIDYMIQFPPDTYDGKGYKLRTEVPGLIGDQNTMISRKDTSRASVYATFCNSSAYPCSLYYYGDSLKLPLPESIPYKNSKGEADIMNNRVTFGMEGKIHAILYFAVDPYTVPEAYEGRLYTIERESGIPRAAGIAQFNERSKQEIFDILSTIAPR